MEERKGENQRLRRSLTGGSRSRGRDAGGANRNGLDRVSFAREGQTLSVEQEVDPSGIAGLNDDIGPGAEGALIAGLENFGAGALAIDRRSAQRQS